MLQSMENLPKIIGHPREENDLIPGKSDEILFGGTVETLGFHFSGKFQNLNFC